MPDRPPVKFTARHIGRSTIQEIEMNTIDMPGVAGADDTDCTDCEGTGITGQTERFCTCSNGIALRTTHSRPAPTFAEAMALPEVAALVEASRKVHRSYWYNTDGVIQGMYDLEMALAPFTAAKEPKA